MIYTTRTVYTDSLTGSSKLSFIIKMPLLVNIGLAFSFLFQIFLSLLLSFFRFLNFPIKSHFLRRRKIAKN